MRRAEYQQIMVFLMLGLFSTHAATSAFCCEPDQQQAPVKHRTHSMDDPGCHPSDEQDFINDCEDLHCCPGNVSLTMDQNKPETAPFHRAITGFHHPIYSGPRPVRVYHPPEPLL